MRTPVVGLTVPVTAGGEPVIVVVRFGQDGQHALVVRRRWLCAVGRAGRKGNDAAAEHPFKAAACVHYDGGMVQPHLEVTQSGPVVPMATVPAELPAVRSAASAQCPVVKQAQSWAATDDVWLADLHACLSCPDYTVASFVAGYIVSAMHDVELTLNL